jgi:hypothetical protein
MKDVGNIVIKLHRKSYGKPLKPSESSRKGIPSKVAEKTLKGESVSHGTR